MEYLLFVLPITSGKTKVRSVTSALSLAFRISRDVSLSAER